MRVSRQTLEAAGPAFIKWGQWAATRHDLFPPDLCAELEHLHTQVTSAQEPFFLVCFQDFSTQDVKSQAYKLCRCRHRSPLRRAITSQDQVLFWSCIRALALQSGVGARLGNTRSQVERWPPLS